MGTSDRDERVTRFAAVKLRHKGGRQFLRLWWVNRRELRLCNRIINDELHDQW